MTEHTQTARLLTKALERASCICHVGRRGMARETELAAHCTTHAALAAADSLPEAEAVDVLTRGLTLVPCACAVIADASGSVTMTCQRCDTLARLAAGTLRRRIA